MILKGNNARWYFHATSAERTAWRKEKKWFIIHGGYFFDVILDEYIGFVITKSGRVEHKRKKLQTQAMLYALGKS